MPHPILSVLYQPERYFLYAHYIMEHVLKVFLKTGQLHIRMITYLLDGEVANLLNIKEDVENKRL